MVCRHVVIELGSILGIVPQVFEEVRFGFVSQLKGTVFTVVGGLEVVLTEESWQGLHTTRDTTGPFNPSAQITPQRDERFYCLHALISITVSWHTERSRKPSPTVLVRAGFVDHSMGGQMFEDTSYKSANIFRYVKKNRIYKPSMFGSAPVASANAEAVLGLSSCESAVKSPRSTLVSIAAYIVDCDQQ